MEMNRHIDLDTQLQNQDTAPLPHMAIIKLWGKGYSIQIASGATREHIDDLLALAEYARDQVTRPS